MAKFQNNIKLTLVPAVRPLLAICLILFAGLAVLSQEVYDNTVPPPPKVIPPADQDRLEAQTDVKKRTKLALELMDAKLGLAQQHATAGNYDGMFIELGIFHGLIDHTLAFLQDSNSKKAINNFKRLEIGLRKFPPRLGMIRSDLPVRYEFYVRVLLRYIRQARAKAIEPLFGDTVIPDNDPNQYK